jgi:hypothetical protein
LEIEMELKEKNRKNEKKKLSQQLPTKRTQFNKKQAAIMSEQSCYSNSRNNYNLERKEGGRRTSTRKKEKQQQLLRRRGKVSE